MFEKLSILEEKYLTIEKQLADPIVLSDQNKYRELSKIHSDLTETVNAFREYKKCKQTIAESETLLKEESDSELREMAKEELESAKKSLGELEEQIKILMIPKDPADRNNAYLEIRQGTGGEEAALFALDILSMYEKYAETKKWGFETLSVSPADAGGIKEVVVLVTGDGVYGKLKYESGIHRVQRVPKTEASGRIHTSAATVAVMPEQESVNSEINTTDLRIDTYRASGSGGQHVNKTDSAVRITHLPSGFVVACQDGRSQHQNKDKAMRLLQSKLSDHLKQQQQATDASARKSMVGSGDRSEKIRTYNFPQGRVTDHRIGLTLHKLPAILQGEIDEIINGLIAADRVEKLKDQ